MAFMGAILARAEPKQKERPRSRRIYRSVKKTIGAGNNFVALSGIFLSAPLTLETCSLQSDHTQVSQHFVSRAHNTIANTGQRPSALLPNLRGPIQN